MKQGITQAIRGDRVGLTDLLEKLADAGVRFSDLLLHGQTFRIRVTGWSMYPTLHPGDQITVEPASPVQLQVGELILFHDRGNLICHRLVAVQETGAGPRLITKGDARNGCETPAWPEQVLGRVVGIRPNRLVRLRDKVSQGLLVLHSLRFYRRMMRALMSRGVAYYFEIPEVGEGFRHNRIGGRGILELLKGHHRFQLVAKFAGIYLGSVYVEAGADGFWLHALYVRIRYRGMGIASKLVALAATVSAMNGASALLAWVEPANSASLALFTKMGFRKTGGLRGNEVSLRQDL